MQTEINPSVKANGERGEGLVLTVDEAYKMQLLCAYEVRFRGFHPSACRKLGTSVDRSCDSRLLLSGIQNSVNSSQRRNGKDSIMREFTIGCLLTTLTTG